MPQAHKHSLNPSRPGARARRRPTGPGHRLKQGSDTPLISAFIKEDGTVAIQRVAESFGMSKGQLAETVGLGRETFHKTARANAAKTQNRMREMLEIVSRISAWAGGKDQAMAWYRAQPIAAFGDRTAEALVKSGQAAAVRDYLDHLALGGFA
jgi:ribosome-binding protein aMBF1 (putative translation factor)